jgi:hypothetical protein
MTKLALYNTWLGVCHELLAAMLRINRIAVHCNDDALLCGSSGVESSQRKDCSGSILSKTLIRLKMHENASPLKNRSRTFSPFAPTPR